MILNFVLLFIASAILFSLLMPKPKIENAVAQEFDEEGFPKSSENAPIPYLIGKTKLESPNTLFAGNFRTVPITQRVRVSLFKKKTIIVGYSYYMTLDLGWCIGGSTGCTLHEIIIDEQSIWTGTITGVGSGNAADREMFGGYEKGGGWDSNFVFYPGTLTQPVDAYIDALPGSLGLQTPYRGVCHIVFRDAYIGESPQIRKISAVISRFTNELGLIDNKHLVGTESVNLAEGMYELMTNEYGGLGASPDLFDIPAFIAAGYTLYDEGQGLAGVISNDSTGEGIIKEFLKQADALLTIDPQTNLVQPFLLRKDYDIATLPSLNASSIVKVDRFTQTLWGELVSEVKVGFKNPANNYQNTTAVAQDLAVANITGKLRTVSVSLPFCKDLTLANNIAGRELNQLSQIVTMVRFKANRNSYMLVPGAVFKWSWPDYGITDMILRVKEISDGDDEKPIITVDAVRDTYDNTNNPFALAVAGVSTPLTSRAANVVTQSIYEAHEFFVKNQPSVDIPVYTANVAYPVVIPVPPNSQHVSFDLAVDNEVVESLIPFSLTASLTPSIAIADNFDTMVIPTLDIDGVDTTRLDELFNDGAAAVRDGAQLFYINDELFGYETFTDNGGGSVTLNNVHRALLNTKPRAHAAADDVIFFDLSLVSPSLTAVADSPVDIQYLTSTGPYSLSLATATTFNKAMVGSIAYPDPPDYLYIDGSRVPPTTLVALDTFTATWRARDKTINSIRLYNDAADTKPAGMTYTVELWNVTQGTGPDYTSAGLTAATDLVTIPSDYARGDLVELRVYAVENTYTSLVPDLFQFEIPPLFEVLLSGDEQSGTDRVSLSGDQQSGTDALDLSGDEA